MLLSISVVTVKKDGAEDKNIKMLSQLEDVIHAFTLETAGYASDSLSAFNDALTNAKNVLNDASATQETMNAAMKDLFNAPWTFSAANRQELRPCRK